MPRPAEPRQEVTVALTDLNILIRDIQTLGQVKEQRDILQAIVDEYKKRTQLTESLITSQRNQIGILQRNLEFLMKEQKTSFGDVLQEISKYLLGAAIGATVVLIAK